MARVCERGWVWLVVSAILIAAGALPAFPAAAQDPCEGLVTPRLAVGGSARVISSFGVSLKDAPRTGAAGAREVAQLPPGTTVSVMDGHRCNLGYVWWQVLLDDGRTGWAAEGDSADYYLEPVTLGLHMFWRRPDGRAIMHYFVTPDASAEPRASFTVEPLETTPQQAWQQVEIERLDEALDALRADCPDRLTGSVWEGVDTLDAALQVPLPTLTYDYYPAPDGERLLLARHLTLPLPRCDTVVPEQIGVTQVSLLSAGGTETLLFPYPQHGSVPPSDDRYAPSDPADSRNVYLDEVVWSPNGRYIAFLVAYRDACTGETCYRFHLYVWNVETGQLYVPGEGRHVGWTNAGEALNVFRLVSGAEGTQAARLFTMRPDGSNRQEIWLPGGAVYVSGEQRSLGLPWNEGGTRVMVANAGMGEVMLFTLSDRDFTPPVALPDMMQPLNRLAVHLIRTDSQYLWTTIRGDFATQNVRTGDWQVLSSSLGPTGSAPLRVRPFGSGATALVEMANGTAYVLDAEADRLTPVTYVD